MVYYRTIDGVTRRVVKGQVSGTRGKGGTRVPETVPPETVLPETVLPETVPRLTRRAR
jgi:hypothetical protein